MGWNSLSIPKFNATIVKIWEWIWNFIRHFTGHVITYPYLNSSYSLLVKGAPSGPLYNLAAHTWWSKCWKHVWFHDDVIKRKHFPRYWPFARGIHRSPVNSQHKGQWRRAWMFSLICAWINRWVNNGKAGELRRYRAHYGVIVMFVCR